MQDTTPAEVDIIAAEEPDPDDPPRRADWHLAQAKKPYRGYPLASMQRHKTFSRPAECPRPRPPTGVSRVQRLAVWTPPLAEVLNDLFNLLVTNLDQLVVKVAALPLDDHWRELPAKVNP